MRRRIFVGVHFLFPADNSQQISIIFNICEHLRCRSRSWKYKNTGECEAFSILSLPPPFPLPLPPPQSSPSLNRQELTIYVRNRLHARAHAGNGRHVGKSCRQQWCKTGRSKQLKWKVPWRSINNLNLLSLNALWPNSNQKHDNY